MGFFDRDVEGGFDAMFDWNHDGQLNPEEQAMQVQFLDRTSRGLDPWDDSHDDDSEGEE